MARNPPACPAEKRSLGENLVTDWRMSCSAQVRLRTEAGRDSISFVLKFRLGSAGEPNICSHCYSVPYMKIPANNQVILSSLEPLWGGCKTLVPKGAIFGVFFNPEYGKNRSKVIFSYILPRVSTGFI